MRQPRLQAIGTLACAAAAAGGVWVVASLWLGPGIPAALPLRAIAAVSAAAALAGALGLALRGGPAPAIVLLAGIGAPLANTRMIGSQDTVATGALPFVIVREHALTFAQGGENFLVPVEGGRFASRYPIATALLALPFELPAAAGNGPATEPLRKIAEKLAAAALSGCILAFLYLAMRGAAGERAAAQACALTLFGTALLPILGQALWQHTGAALALSAGLAALSCLPQGSRRAALVGLCAGVAVACRPPDLPLALALLVGLLPDRSARTWAGALLAAALPLLLTILYQRAVFGSLLSTGYGNEARAGWRPLWPDGAIGFAGLWLSPGRGLAIVSPLLVAGLATLLRGSGFLRALGLAVIAESILMGCWWAWDGGWSAGPRMLSDAIPFLALGLACALRDAPRWGRPRRAAFAAAAAVSCTNALLLTYAVPRPETHALVWELRDGPWTPRSYPLVAYGR